jgi:hypothetical protein
MLHAISGQPFEAPGIPNGLSESAGQNLPEAWIEHTVARYGPFSFRHEKRTASELGNI